MGNKTAGRSELKEPQNFAEFWPFYVGEHLNPLTRFIHVCGTTLALILLGAVLLSGSWMGLIIIPFIGYGFAWFSHFIIERNRPATFRYPLWSLRADFIMLYKTFNNTMQEEVRNVKIKKGLGIFVFLCFSMSLHFTAQADPACTSAEVEELKARYDDFYKRKREAELMEIAKNKGIAEFKKHRAEVEAQMEKDRRERVAQRKNEVDTISPLEEAWLQEQKEIKKRELKLEREYARHMEEVKKCEDTSKYRIPPDDEYELEQ